jgi:hypothetical protein
VGRNRCDGISGLFWLIENAKAENFRTVSIVRESGEMTCKPKRSFCRSV